MYIQYVGFNVAASSRIYNFDVIDTKEAREFTVKVQSEAFRPGSLKLQDGPDICFARLKLELAGETQESRSEAHLSLGERDIQEYSEQHYPREPLSTKHHRSADRIVLLTSSRMTGVSQRG
jgi:hypothetical protein